MFGDSIQSAGDTDGISDATIRKNREEDAVQAEGHIQEPKCYPSWAPELARRSRTGGDNHVSRDVPLLREIEGKSALLRDGWRKSRKRRRAGDICDASLQYNPKLRGQEIPLLVDDRPRIGECTITQFSTRDREGVRR